MPSFPRTEVGGISLPRMLIGSNWINGYSHTSPASDKMIRSYHNSPERIAELLEAYLEYDINAIMALFKDNPQLLEGIKIAEERTGKKIIRIDTPTMNVADTAEARREALETVRYSKEVVGADFCLIHHSSAEQLVNKGKGTIERLPDYLYMIREAGMHPGLSAHMPELVLYSDANEYDVETYIQIYNCMGFLMQVEVEYINQVIWNAKKPVMTIKSMAAGRCSPFVGITFSYNTIRPCDMVTMGAFNPDEVHEDVEIALAAIEHRRANIGGRATPNKTAALGGKVK
ncbi:MAG: hypothetical protein E7428_05810 [Ruminococcaceae bacterium]|nr:hypothetical protein [Oscillospiraceae bacterium]